MKLRHEHLKGKRVTKGFWAFQPEGDFWYDLSKKKWVVSYTGEFSSSHVVCRSARAFRRKLKKAPKGISFTLFHLWEGLYKQGHGSGNIKGKGGGKCNYSN